MIEYINTEDRKPRLINGGIDAKRIDQFLVLWSNINSSFEKKTNAPKLLFLEDTQSLPPWFGN